MELVELLNSKSNISITIGIQDLETFAKNLIQSTKKELEAELIALNTETHKTRLETCEILKVDQSTLFRWAKRGYLNPVEVGGRRMYKMSDLKRILSGGRN